MPTTGAVAKKIALFEFPVENTSCRLKRKHAIKRRKQKTDVTCRDSPTSEEGSDRSIAYSVNFSRSESDLCSSYGYGTGTGTELNSISSISRQSSPSIVDSDPPLESNTSPGISDNNLESNIQDNNVHLNFMSKSNLFSCSSTSNYNLNPQAQAACNSLCVAMKFHDCDANANRAKHAHRDGVNSESSLSIDHVSPHLTDDEFTSLSQSIQDETVANVTEQKCTEEPISNPENENYYTDDAFPSQNQINLKFPATRQKQNEDERVVVKLEKFTINESSTSTSTPTRKRNGVNKKLKFQSIYTFTNNAKKKCLTSKKLFFFGHNFLPQTPHGNSSPTSSTSTTTININTHNLSAVSSEVIIQNPNNSLPSLCRSKSLSEIESVPSLPSPEVVNKIETNEKRVKSKIQLKQILDKIKSMEKEIVNSPTQTPTHDDGGGCGDDDDDEENSEPFYEEVDELKSCNNVTHILSKKNNSSKNNIKDLSSKPKQAIEISTEGILKTGATAGVKEELATLIKTTTTTTTPTSTKTNQILSAMSTFRLKDKVKKSDNTWRRNHRRHSADCPTSTNLSLAAGVPTVKDEDSPTLASCSTPPPYESLYSEPIYGQSSSSIKSSLSNLASGGPSWSHLKQSQSQSSQPSTVCTDTELNYNASISSFDQNSSIYSANYYGKSPINLNSPPTAGVNYGIKTLPPPPTSISSTGKCNSLNELPSKFSSITKTGRKLAKKILSIRRVSRTNSFDVESAHHPHHHQYQQQQQKQQQGQGVSAINGGGEGGRRVSSPAKIQYSPSLQGDNYNQIYAYSSDSFSGSSTSGRSSIETSGMRRSISRPNVAPPAPPPPLTSNDKSIPPTLPPPNPVRGLQQQRTSRFGSGSIKNSRDHLNNEEKPFYSNLTSVTPTHPKTKTDCNNYLTNSTTSTSHKSSTDLHSQQNYNEDFDDYEDSDFYDSDSELIRNFVSAVQPIYSMEEEPLYQYYTYGISIKPEDDYQPVIPKNLGLTLDMLVPRVGQRTLWCELPEVNSSGILGILSDKQKQLQEAIFEILTSEVSYLKSLDVLISLFYESHELKAVLSSEEMKFICGNIKQVRDCSQSFLAELLGKWDESWYIQEIGEIINEYALTRLTVYIDYCRNKPQQDRTLQRLRLTNDEFVSVIKCIEENPKCQMLRMDSFLMLPMQRITRLPLLVNAVIQRTQSLKEKGHCDEALKNLTNLVLDCNEAARESQDAEETASIVEKIEFPRGMKSLNAQSLGQFILKGDFMRNPFDQNNGRSSVSGQINWTFRKTKRTFYWLILFSNTLIVARKKSSGKFEALDVVPTADSNIKPLPNIDGLSKDFQYYFMLHFNRKETVYFLGARTQSEVERWKKKIESLKCKDLQVEAIFPYDAQREDELSFDVGDLIRVSQMQADGWYFGSKIKSNGNDKDSGWFPGNYCAEL